MKAAFAGQVGQRLAVGAALAGLGEGRGGGRVELVVVVGDQPGALTLQLVAQQPLGVQPVQAHHAGPHQRLADGGRRRAHSSALQAAQAQDQLAALEGTLL